MTVGLGPLAEVFAEPCPRRARAPRVATPLAVLPVLFAMLWRGALAATSTTRCCPAGPQGAPGETMVKGDGT